MRFYIFTIVYSIACIMLCKLKSQQNGKEILDKIRKSEEKQDEKIRKGDAGAKLGKQLADKIGLFYVFVPFLNFVVSTVLMIICFTKLEFK